MSDLISRQAAIDVVNGIDRYFGKYIEALPSAQQWIPCSERLPERDKRVLVTIFNDYDIGYIDTDPDNMQLRWCFESFNLYGDEMEDVKAWMPLPEPYREDEKI